MSLHPKMRVIFGAIKNRIAGDSYDLAFVSEAADWAVLRISQCVAKPLQEMKMLKTRVTESSSGLTSKIIHFGSVHMLFDGDKIRKFNPGSRVTATWFHIFPDDPKLALLRDQIAKVDRIHTTCGFSKQQLLAAGIPAEKVVLIPLGVDHSMFRPPVGAEREDLRRELKVLPGHMLIGSFQKDGDGWGEGMNPKLVKGPDIFVETLKLLKRSLPVQALLAGPARGYVKRRLTEEGIPFIDLGNLPFDNRYAQYYRALDAYLISSRLEGGPMAIQESWASGVPLVSTRVGMIPDIATDGKNALLADIEDSAKLADNCRKIFTDASLRERLIVGGLTESARYDWSVIAKRYYNELYKPLL